VKPTSKMGARHLQRRVSPQMLEGALTTEIIGFSGEPDAKSYGAQPMLEFVDDMEEIWNLTEGNPELSDHWRFNQWDAAAMKEYYKYGWVGNCGNYALRADAMPLRFLDLQKQNADGTFQLQVVFPYKNIPATEGIKEELNQAWQDAPIQLDFIWHRMAMTSLVRDSAAINPEMPFAMRDFAGRWMFAMDNLTCGTDINGNPIAVDNSWRNKGKFQAMWSFATQAEHPEFAEAFLTLREPACIVDIPRCAADPGYPSQSYSSSNAICPGVSSTLTFTPVLNPVTGFYELPRDTVLCNSLPILNPPITGSATIAALVIQLNATAPMSSMGTWAQGSATTITLTGSVCQSVNLPFTVD
jgi:hypothetical protein